MPTLLRPKIAHFMIVTVAVLLALSIWKQEFRRDVISADQTPDLTLLVLLDRMRMTDLDAIKNLTSPAAFETIEGVCRNPKFQDTRLRFLAIKRGLNDNELRDARLIWQKWAEAINDNDVKWLRQEGSSTKLSPVFSKDESATFVFEQQSDGTWQVTEVTLNMVR